MKLHTIFAVPLAVCFPASAVDWQLWNSLNGEMLHHAEQKDFRGALPFAIRAVEAARQASPVDGRLAESLSALGALRTQTGEYREAEKALLEAVALAQPLPDYQPQLAIALGRLATLYYEAGGRAGEVESLRRRALDIASASLGPEAPQVGVHLAHLATSLIARRRYSDAEVLLRRALRLTGEGDFPALAADMYSGLGTVAYHEKRYAEALELFDRAGRLFRQAGGAASPGLMIQLTAVGRIYLKIGRPADADRALAQAEEIAVQVYGPEHAYVAEVLSVRVKSLRKLGRRKEATQASQRAQTIIAARRAQVSAVNSRIDIAALIER